MARPNIPEEASPYYPPRARWYSPLLGWGGALRRRTRLDRIHLPADMTIGGLIGSFFIPGLGVYLRGPRTWGLAALGSWSCVCVLSIVWFGRTTGHFAFGLLQAIHTIGFVHYCHPLLRPVEFRSRVLFTLLALLVIGGLIYFPIRRIIQQHWPAPLHGNGPGMVVPARFAAGPVQRGVGIAGLEKHWSGRPELDISGHGNVGEANISAVGLPWAAAAQARFVGKPFQQWLWRRQITT